MAEDYQRVAESWANQGATVQGWEAHRRTMATLQSFEVRIVGDFQALKDALTASGHDFTISQRTPKSGPSNG